MIPEDEVDAALLAKLRTTGLAVGDQDAPPDTTPPYVVLEAPGGGTMVADMNDLNGAMTLRRRVTCVGRDATNSGLATVQAKRALVRCRAVLFPVGSIPRGATWSVARVVHESFNGALVDGPDVNMSDDVLVMVTGI